MKIAVIGCTHAGTAAILNAAELYPDAKITVYERNDNISFLSCGIALYVGGVIKDSKGLFYSSPEELAKLGVETKMKHDVVEANLDEKYLEVKNLDNGKVSKEVFDKLIITTGSWPVVPPIENINLENIQLCKNYNHAKAIIEKSKGIDNVVVVGGGYIGVELAEAFEQNGKNVTLIDAQERILSRYLDEMYTDMAEGTFREHGVKLALGELVQRFEGKEGKVTHVVTNKETHEAELVVLCIGFRPNTDLFKGQLNQLPNGAIIIDEYMKTSHPDVVAAGDACSVIYNPTGENRYIPLATNAIRMGTLAAYNLVDNKVRYLGTQGTSGIKIYNLNISSTGLTEDAAKEANVAYETVVVEDHYRPEFMPTHEMARLKMVYEKGSGKIKGAQIVSHADLTQMMNTVSVCIQNEMTMQELAFVDFFFQPHYSKPWNLLNVAGLKTLQG
ncbi:MAG: FAD-dependent oxidoreductase [Tissierellales bacterium]|jgi:NADPH-dependent 2,4-dienoyl-CoA reductase/sulfur reductase-like enzyme|nr:FAD-dependent oxidoreductase [Tissierellales bacterium]